MKTRRTRMLVIVVAAAVVVSFFIHWDEAARGFWDGWNSYPAAHSH